MPTCRAALLVVGALLGASCERDVPFHPLAPAPAPTAPGPATSPARALRALEAAWSARDSAQLSFVFGGDFTFAFAVWDTSGNPWKTTPWGRAEELLSFGRMVGAGTPYASPMNPITLDLDNAFNVQTDPRPGRSDPERYGVIRSAFTLDATEESTGFPIRITGTATFYLSRGDATVIPPEIRTVFPGPDSEAWFITRWEDETFSGESTIARGQPARALPSRSMTLGSFKALYIR